MNSHILFVILFIVSIVQPVDLPNINRYIGMGLFFVIALIFLYTLLKDQSWKKLWQNFHWEVLVIVLFLAVNGLSLFLNLHRFEDFNQLVFFGFSSFAVWMIFPMIWVILQHNNNNNYQWLGWSLVSFILLTAFLQIHFPGAAEYITNYTVAKDAPISTSSQKTVITSVTRWHTVFAIIAALSFLTSIKCLLSPTAKTKEKVFFISLLILALYTGILCESRNFVFTLVIGLLAYSYKAIIKHPYRSILTSIILLLSINIIIINNDNVAQDYGKALPYLAKLNKQQAVSINDFIPTYDNTSTSGRVELWQRGLKLWQENKWLGIGAGSYHLSGRHWQTNLNLHNYYLQVLVDSGIIGSIIFLILFLLLIKRSITAGNFVIFIAIAASLIFDNYLDYSMGWVLFMSWFLLVSKEHHSSA